MESLILVHLVSLLHLHPRCLSLPVKHKGLQFKFEFEPVTTNLVKVCKVNQNLL